MILSLLYVIIYLLIDCLTSLTQLAKLEFNYVTFEGFDYFF